MTERPPTCCSRQRRHGSTAIATLLLTGVLVASDVQIGGTATPPAELVSVITEIGDSFGPTMSGDGALVAFDYDNYVDDGSTQLSKVRNRADQQTEAVPFAAADNDAQSNTAISRDGCHVAFIDIRLVTNGQSSYLATEIFVRDRCAGTPTHKIHTNSSSEGATVRGLDISDHGRYVTLDNGLDVQWFDRDADANGVFDEGPPVLATSSTQTSGGALGDETLTNKVAIASLTSGYAVQVFLWDPTVVLGSPGSYTLVSALDGTVVVDPTRNANDPDMTPDGRYVTYVTTDDYPGGGYDFPDQVMIRDVTNNHTALISRTTTGAGGNGTSWQPSITADGTQVAFSTFATNLIAVGPGGIFGDGVGPSFDLLVAASTVGFYATVAMDRVSLKPNGDAIDTSNGDLVMQNPVISSSGRWVAFESSYASELQTGVGTVFAPGLPSRYYVEVYVMARLPTMTVSPLDFGQIEVGAVSGVAFATVTNSGNSSFLPASLLGDGDFAVVTGGTCAIGMWMSPGQSCTVGVQFMPSAAGPRNSLLRIAEGGFAAVTATGALTATGFVVPVQTTTTTTTPPTTTAPPTTTKPPTTTAPPTTTTVAKTQKLVVTPNPGSFGTTMVGVPATPIAFAITSTGTGSTTIGSIVIGGNNASSFVIAANACQGTSLAPGTSCGVTVVFTPDASGVQSATITATSTSAVASANLDGTGALQPTVRLLPNVVTAGDVTIAVGAGFAPNSIVQFQWLGDTETFSAGTDASGAVQLQIPVRFDEMTGNRDFIAVDQPGVFSAVSTTGLIVDPSASPPTSRNPAAPELASLVVRG
ncbi:MAG: choice-of-anchor D domain-containing protein [Ilumatobacteraceae bacterium]